MMPAPCQTRRHVVQNLAAFGRTTEGPECSSSMPPDVNRVLGQVAVLENTATEARISGDEVAAESAFRAGLELVLGVVEADLEWRDVDDKRRTLRRALHLALHCGETCRARQLVDALLLSGDPGAAAAEWRDLLDCSRWPDAWLVAAARRDPPDMPALNALVGRTWKRLFARCRVLTSDHDTAGDLAQQTWVRVLRGLRDLKPGGNVHAYLAMIATNLWRDAYRAKRRAGPLAPDRLASLQEPRTSEAGAGIVWGDVLPDPALVQSREHALLMQDVEHALGKLPSHLREVVIARFFGGESCASIGARHGRTEQTVSGWLRAALAELKRLLEEPAPVVPDPCKTQPNPCEESAAAR